MTTVAALLAVFLLDTSVVVGGAPRGPRGEFRRWVDTWAAANGATLVEWGTAELEAPGVVDWVALVCRPGDARGAHLVMSPIHGRFVARFDDDPDGLYLTGPCSRPVPDAPPRFRLTRAKRLDHYIPVKRAGGVLTSLAIRQGELVVVAEHGDESYIVSDDLGVDWDRRRRWPREGSYMRIVCERVR